MTPNSDYPELTPVYELLMTTDRGTRQIHDLHAFSSAGLCNNRPHATLPHAALERPITGKVGSESMARESPVAP